MVKHVLNFKIYYLILCKTKFYLKTLKKYFKGEHVGPDRSEIVGCYRIAEKRQPSMGGQEWWVNTSTSSNTQELADQTKPLHLCLACAVKWMTWKRLVWHSYNATCASNFQLHFLFIIICFRILQTKLSLYSGTHY